MKNSYFDTSIGIRKRRVSTLKNAYEKLEAKSKTEAIEQLELKNMKKSVVQMESVKNVYMSESLDDILNREIENKYNKFNNSDEDMPKVMKKSK